MNPNGISRWTPIAHIYAVGRLKTTSCAVIENGRFAAPPAPGLSTLPVLTLTCGWNGGVPPGTDQAFRVPRVVDTPGRARGAAFSVVGDTPAQRGPHVF